MSQLHCRNRPGIRYSVLLITILVVMAVLALQVAVRAGTLSDLSDTMSRLRVSEAANHLIEFTTPSGVGEGENFTITFAAEFDTGSITENDVDVEDDGIDLTTASDCSGVDEASVTMSGDVLTITICPGDGGAIAPGSVVTVEIGTTAAASGVGTNRIINPAGSGSYIIDFDGTFGDTGTVVVAIMSDDQVSVTAVVESQGGGGTEPEICELDFTPPTITAIDVEDVSESSATVTWSTDEVSTSIVEYGLSDSYEMGTESTDDLVTSHLIELSNLDFGTTYHFRVRSSDACGNETVSGDQTFTTEGPLLISDVQVTNITQTSAIIVWYTNKAADSLVEYGLTEAYSGSEFEAAPVTEHSVVLSGLSEDTLYHFRVVSETDTERDESFDDTFLTVPFEGPPNVLDFQAEPGPGSLEITLTWSNPDSDGFEGVVIYRRDDDWPTVPGDGDLVYNGDDESVIDTDVQKGIRYYYCAYSYNDLGLYSTGACDDAMIPVSITLNLRAHPEKRSPATGNWHTDFDFGIREQGSIDPFYEINVLTSDEAGEATIDLFDVALGIYDFSGKGLSHLNKNVSGQMLDDEVWIDFTFGNTFELLAGDTDPTHDNFVNSLDISALVSDLNIDDEISDLNQDSLVNSLDINILLANLNIFGEM